MSQTRRTQTLNSIPKQNRISIVVRSLKMYTQRLDLATIIPYLQRNTIRRNPAWSLERQLTKRMTNTMMTDSLTNRLKVHHAKIQASGRLTMSLLRIFFMTPRRCGDR
jgi:hypothetical protein